MTCIVGLVNNGDVWIGGDSAGVASDFSRQIRIDSKVFAVGPMLIGYTTSFRMGQLLRYRLTLPAHPDGMDSHEYMATEFVDAVRACLSKGGFSEKEKEREIGGFFLVGYRGRLFQIESDYQVGEDASGEYAVGGGDKLAMGALFATRHIQQPRYRVEKALEAAAERNAGVSPPFVVHCLRAEETFAAVAAE
jgi:hypothetical protein